MMDELELFVPAAIVKADLKKGFITCDPSGDAPGRVYYVDNSPGAFSSRPHGTMFVRCPHCGWTMEEELFARLYVQRELLRKWLSAAVAAGRQLYIDGKKATFNASEDTITCKGTVINISSSVYILWPEKRKPIKYVIVECTHPLAEGKISCSGDGISLETLISKNYE
jgi:hypothetical protein